ncbi:isocitrate/isopropylmalate dehydrogenase family protein [Pigmentiphaga soli]|uniref:Isocitrate/isopropylmalate dehydrogenase family protein n=1 Tax=Pigmentiphaga soli TaxID=1007095 RepID=A0ABP8HJH3_9BURK
MRVGVLKGNGIGPEITSAVLQVLEATGLPLEWVHIPIADEAVERYGHPLPRQVVDALREVKVALKAPLIVNKGEGRLSCVQEDGSEVTYPSLNNAIRRELKLFVNPRPLRGIPGISGRYENLDVVVMREVTEDVYVGWEHRIGDVAAQAIKLTTREAAVRVARYSFDYARRNGRRKVSCLHKANVLNYTDGLFLRCCAEVAREYPDIEFDDYMIDAACYLIIKEPQRFDVVVTPNQYGDILSDLGAGLVGSLGLAPGANIGEVASVFEASHGAAPDIAGKGIANPVALLLSGALLLQHAGHGREAASVVRATRAVLGEGKVLTRDLGGTANTLALAGAIADRVRASDPDRSSA